MKLLKLPVKIILAPIVLAMTGIVFVLALMMAVSTRLLAIASSLLGTFALLVFITGDAKNGGMVLLLAFLVSPYGLPKAAEWLDRKSTRLNSSHDRQSRMPSSA